MSRQQDWRAFFDLAYPDVLEPASDDACADARAATLAAEEDELVDEEDELLEEEDEEEDDEEEEEEELLITRAVSGNAPASGTSGMPATATVPERTGRKPMESCKLDRNSGTKLHLNPSRS